MKVLNMTPEDVLATAMVVLNINGEHSVIPADKFVKIIEDRIMGKEEEQYQRFKARLMDEVKADWGNSRIDDNFLADLVERKR